VTILPKWRWRSDASSWFFAPCIASAANVGPYQAGGAGGQTFEYVHRPGAVYAIDLDIAAVLTNTAPIGVTRGWTLPRPSTSSSA
jgi:hypothetical protein